MVEMVEVRVEDGELKEMNKKNHTTLNPMAQEFKPQMVSSPFFPRAVSCLIWQPINPAFFLPPNFLKPIHHPWLLNKHMIAEGQTKKTTTTMIMPKKKKKTHSPKPISGKLLPYETDKYYPFGKSTTSLMIRNLPVRLRRGELMELLDEHCREENNSKSTAPSEFDFLYLPIDFKRKGNKGYAFVNFTNGEGAARLFNSWAGTNWLSSGHSTRKICRFCPARFQGRHALKNHFSKSVFRCESDDYLPIEIIPARNGSNGGDTCLVSVGTRVHRGC